MASSKLKVTKDGKAFYEIRSRNGRDSATCTMRWYVPSGWSAKAISRELAKQEAEFDRQVHSGEILPRSIRKEREAEEAAEAAKIRTVCQYVESVFMPGIKSRCAANTIASFRGMLDKHILPSIGSHKLPEVTPAELTALLRKMQSDGLSFATVNKCRMILSLIFKDAYLDESIDRNPMDKVSRIRARKDENTAKEVECFSADELRNIFVCLESESLMWQCFVRLLADTGMRRGEANGLQWGDIDLKKGEIQITRSAGYTKEKGVFCESPKNGRSRTVFIGDAVIALLKKLKAEGGFPATNPEEWVFVGEDHVSMLHPQAATKFFARFAKRHGIAGFHPHKMRHTFASLAITGGADVTSVSECLGHSDVAVTLRVYSHASQESMKKAGNIVRDALKTGNG